MRINGKVKKKKEISAYIYIKYYFFTKRKPVIYSVYVKENLFSILNCTNRQSDSILVLAK